MSDFFGYPSRRKYRTIKGRYHLGGLKVVIHLGRNIGGLEVFIRLGGNIDGLKVFLFGWVGVTGMSDVNDTHLSELSLWVKTSLTPL